MRPLLMLGFVRLADHEPVRRAVQLQREVVQDLRSGLPVASENGSRLPCQR